MQQFRASNLCGIGKLPWLALRPLTLVLSGRKAEHPSIACLIAVLRQSVDSAGRHGPIQLQGRLIDAGLPEAGVRAAELGFGVVLRPETRFGNPVRATRIPDPITAPIDVRAVLSLVPHSDHDTCLVRLTLHIAEEEVDLVIDECGRVARCTIGSYAMARLGGAMQTSPYACMVPSLGMGTGLGPTVYCPESGVPDSFWGLWDEQIDRIKDETGEVLYPYLPVDMDLRDRWLLVSSLPVGKACLVRHLQDRARDIRGRHRIADLLASPDALGFLHALVIAQNLPGVLRRVDQEVARAASSAQYVGSPRARAARRYPVQDAVSELDPAGGNIATWLHSLPREEQESFGDYTEAYFGFRVATSLAWQRIELRVLGASHDPINLADADPWFAQILPVAANLWLARRRPTSMLAIEDPDLFVASSMQDPRRAGLISAVVEHVAAAPQTSLIIETRERSLIRELGSSLRERGLSASAAQAIRFERRSPEYGVEMRDFDMEDEAR